METVDMIDGRSRMVASDWEFVLTFKAEQIEFVFHSFRYLCENMGVINLSKARRAMGRGEPPHVVFPCLAGYDVTLEKFHCRCPYSAVEKYDRLFKRHKL